jgi:hypothetical protein
MRTRTRLVALLVAPLLVLGGALVAVAVTSSPPGGGTLTRGIAFFGPFSGAEFPAAGTGTVAPGSTRSETTILLPAFAIPNAGGGQDENRVVATIQGYFPGYWIVGAKIKPPVSDYSKESGTLIVWLNKPAPANTPITFSYLTFGIFND